MQELHDFKKDLDKISPTFCVAKWKQVTIHLESGLTHSCHHPKAHTVPLDELEANVSALHNTKYKKQMRKQMLNGEIIPECEYCNGVEKNSTNNFSDRIYKSREVWAGKYMTEIVENGWDYDVFPSYFEVSFTSACNCVCIYCSPTFSTGWAKEIEDHGPYPTSISSRGFDDSPPPRFMGKIHNPYIEAFWKWWPELYEKLEFFRVTGGEPLLSKDTFKILDYIIEKPRKELHIDINSNFTVNQKIFDKFIEKYKKISESGVSVGVFTSCEAKGERAEYIRPGLKYNQWLDNCRKYLLKVPNSQLCFMATYNILSITSFKDYLKDILKLKKEFPLRVMIDIPFLMNPLFLQANIIDKSYLHYIEDAVTFMYKNMDITDWTPLSGTVFWNFEISKLRRIYHMVAAKPLNKGCVNSRKDFVIFIDEHDKRYGTDFLKIFPEYKDFYYTCKGV